MLNNKKPDYVLTRKELVTFLNNFFPDGKTINRHKRDNKGRIIETNPVNVPFNHMDAAEYCRKSWIPKKYLNARILPYKLAFNTPGLIKKEELFCLYIQ